MRNYRHGLETLKTDLPWNPWATFSYLHRLPRFSEAAPVVGPSCSACFYSPSLVRIIRATWKGRCLLLHWTWKSKGSSCNCWQPSCHHQGRACLRVQENQNKADWETDWLDFFFFWNTFEKLSEIIGKA